MNIYPKQINKNKNKNNIKNLFTNNTIHYFFLDIKYIYIL